MKTSQEKMNDDSKELAFLDYVVIWVGIHTDWQIMKLE